jgi:hypothetical protein
MTKFSLLYGIPTSWDDLRRLGQWVGVPLPLTLREALRSCRRLSFLRQFTRDVRNALRIFSLNLRAGVAYNPVPIPQRGTLFRTPWTLTATDPVPDVLRHYCLGGLDRHDIGGDHMSIMTKPHDIQALADILRACIEEAEGAPR